MTQRPYCFEANIKITSLYGCKSIVNFSDNKLSFIVDDKFQ